jgi:phage/plasmid-like protein (TIGR03299 family)
MHEITGRDNVLLVEGHPLSGMGNWHGLGETVDWSTDQHGLYPEDIRRVLGVGNWEVQTVPLADARTEPPTLIDGHVGIACGDQPPHYFPTKQYGVLQNKELVSLANIFKEAAYAERGIDLPILSAGTLRDRRMAFVSVGVPDDAALDGLPARNHAMNLGTSHDGTCALVGCLASYIVVCANTFRASLLGQAPQEIYVRHTQGIEDLAEARAILRGMLSAATATDIAISRLLDTTYDPGYLWNDMTTQVFPKVYVQPDDEKGWTAAHTKQERRVEAIQEVYFSDLVPSDTRGTAWAALMAVQGWEQHERTTRTTKGQQPRHRAALAMQRTVASSNGSGYPLSDALMGTDLSGLHGANMKDLVNA